MRDSTAHTSCLGSYPFGMVMPGRHFDAGSGYRYGFNGKENETEYGTGGLTQDYGFRMYNPALGRFLSVDPLSSSYPWYTPYQYAGNMPTIAIDIDGLEELVVIRWFNQGKFMGFSAFRIPRPEDREPGKRGGGDVQIIDMNYSQQRDVEAKIRNARGGRSGLLDRVVRNPDGTHKGKYRDSMSDLDIITNENLMNRPPQQVLTFTPAPEEIKFPYNSSVIDDSWEEQLQRAKDRLNEEPDRIIIIEGYSSIENGTKDADYNLKLSQQRADEVRERMINDGINPERIVAVGMGVPTGATLESKRNDRKAVMTFGMVQSGN